MADGEDKPEFEVDQLNSWKVINLSCTKTLRVIIVFGTHIPANSHALGVSVTPTG